MEPNNEPRQTMVPEEVSGHSLPALSPHDADAGDETAHVAIGTDVDPRLTRGKTISDDLQLSNTKPRLPSAAEMAGEIRSEAAELRNFTISYLSLLLYVNFIIVSTTHEQILLVAPVTLPLLNVELPIVGFFGFMPWVLFFFHMYILVQHYLFSQHLGHFIWALRKETPAKRGYLRRSLGNLPFLHWMAGDHHALMQLLLTVITLVLLIFWPLMTLLWLQMGFLPYHDEGITWWQRGAVILDVLLLAWIWPTTLDGKDSGLRWWLKIFRLTWLWSCSRFKLSKRLFLSGQGRTRVLRFIAQGAALFLRYILPVPAFGLLLLSTLFLSIWVATIPDSPEEQWVRAHLGDWFQSVDPRGTRTAFMPTAWLHEQHPKLVEPNSEEHADLRSQGAADCPEQEQEIDTADGDRASIQQDAKDLSEKSSAQQDEDNKTVCLMVQPRFSRNLIVRERVIVSNSPLRPDLESAFLSQNAALEPKVLMEIRGVDLSDRNLQYADFQRSAFPKADLRRAKLRNANLADSRLNQADLGGAHLIGTDLSQAKLFDANLNQANLLGANLTKAVLVGADLTEAKLAGADLTQAKLPGANLHRAELLGANLTRADLSGADLTRVDLSAADLTQAKLAGATLTRAKLSGADFADAMFPGAFFVGVQYAGLSAHDAENVTANYRLALSELSKYGNPEGRQILHEEVEYLRQRVSKPAHFSLSSDVEMVPCVRSGAPADSEPKDCLAEPAALKRPEILEFWKKLACTDTTEKRWVAQGMVQRAIEQRRKGREQFIESLRKVQQDGKICPGISNLPDELKAKLQQLPPSRR